MNTRIAATRPRPVHPRACGEHARYFRPVTPCSGSSPRLRGTWLPTLSVSDDLVHPRACGEHYLHVFAISSPRLRGTCRTAIAAAGSSPRLRGTFLSPPLAAPIRFIPAPAGNIFAPPKFGKIGSSPRLRGTCMDARTTQTRFIPAPAGNIARQFLPPDRRAVHPRACGEHCGIRCLGRGAGSSPRLRGTSGY